MLQLIQDLKNGKIEVLNVPAPQVRKNYLLIQTSKSLISTGTEKMLLQFGKANLISKARQQPEKTKQVIQKIKTDGLIPTLEAVKAKIDEPVSLGYCNAGSVIEVGKGVDGFKTGDRVVSNGGHAEIVCIPKNLCAKIPDNVDDETAAFTVPGAIALQGIRLLNPTLGENIVVIGLGLIGQLATQLLISNGCNVLAIDIDENKVNLAKECGAEGVVNDGEDIADKCISFSKGRGVDGVLICVATDSNEPIEQAAKMCRKRGKIVLVGISGLNISRDLFYNKELSFQVSCSYGPGRYDPNYEEKGQDYPIGFVRWTEQRNFQAVLDMMAKEKINVSALTSHTIPLKKAERAYDIILRENPLGIVLTYNEEVKKERKVKLKDIPSKARPQKPVIGFIGTGNFARMVLLPAFRHEDVVLKVAASAGGLSSSSIGRKFGFSYAASDYKEILKDDEINTIVIATRHNTHAKFVIDALAAGKHVFVEKPLCLNKGELEEIAYIINHELSAKSHQPILMVGFNRRFSPCTQKIKKLISQKKEPLCMVMTVNAGFIPLEHWTQDPEVGGGRIIGEACHFIDLSRFITDSPVNTVQAVTTYGHTFGDSDKMTILLTFKDGSIGTVHYFANGSKDYPKEKLEIFCEGKTIVLDNFKSVRAHGFRRRDNLKLWRQDKGHKNEVKEFLLAIEQGKDSPIPFDDIVNTTLATFAAVQSASNGNLIKIAMTEDISKGSKEGI